ncbi:MAG: hypothetical protein IJH63_08105 [Methanobrevibacter sp.]|nr:hypothetical protein [Methanobrevibacter sp.]MBR0370664.1 hypothetical protein [Methanobrevibacter sp.]
MRKILLIICLIFFISIAGVSAEDLNQDISLVQSPNGGTFSELQDKINAADEGSTIKLENNYTYDDSFEDGYITISKKITVDGDGYTIDAKSASGIFNIAAAGVVLNNISFINALSDDGFGGAIYSTDALSINNCIFTDSIAPIYSESDLTVSNSIFRGNVNEYNGGAIFSVGSLTVKDSDFTGNVAKCGSGAAIYAAGDLTVLNCNFNDNILLRKDPEFYAFGGAIYSSGVSKISDSTFTNNTGAIYSECNMEVINSTFIRNVNEHSGGAIYSGADLNISNSIFEDNTAEEGGAVYSQGKLRVSNCLFSGNFAEEGGAVYFTDTMTVSDSNFTGNAAHWLGGGAIYALGDLAVNSSNFIDNDAPDWDYQGNIGGAIYSSGPLNVTYSTFINNTAGNFHEESNNAIYAYAAYANIVYSKFINNYIILTKFSSAFDLDFNSTVVPSGGSVMIFLRFKNENIPGNVTIRINDDEKEVAIVNGSADLPLFDLAPGTYVVNAEYPENDDWWGYSYTARFNVFSGSYVIDAPSLVKYFGGEERFGVCVSEIDGRVVSGKKVVININGEDYQRTTNEDGYASVGVNLNAGKYDVSVKCEDSEVTSSITVKSTMSGKNITKTFRNETQYYAKFLDSEGYYLTNSTVRFNINGVFYDRLTNDSGVAKLNINLNPGEYIITAENPDSGETYSNVITVLANMDENHDLVKYYRNDSQYVIRLLDDEGNPVGAGVNVTFNINGVFYTRTTNATGHAKLNINLEPGTYIITAIYKDLMMSNTITVLPVLEAEDLEMKYLDGSKFNVTLLNGEGKPYAGQNVTFNVNGVFYERTTDANGVAHLNINLMAGEYIITSSYNDSNIANKITISS